MEKIEKTILSTIYVCQINGNESFKTIRENTMLSDIQINEKIDQLIIKNLVKICINLLIKNIPI